MKDSVTKNTNDGGNSQLLVFMFTDLVDSSSLVRQIGDADYVRFVLEPHNKIFRRLLAEFPGATEVKHTGDGFMATFVRSSDAVTCGLRLQHALQTTTWEKVVPQICVGIHLGEAIEFSGTTHGDRDLAGDAANMTARVMSLCQPGQTLLSRIAFDSARQSGRVRADWLDDDSPSQIEWLHHGQYRMKGADEPMEVCEVGITGIAPLRAPTDSDKAKRVISNEESEMLGWRPSPDTPVPDRTEWVLQRNLGEGGFGEVWLAQHKRTHEQRTFKFCFDADRLRSFKRELTFFRLIREHLGERPDIARLYEVHVDSRPFFLESEYIAGGNLKQWSEERGGIKTLKLEERLRLLASVAQAVAAAHSLGIIHKDLKPSNILISERDGTPRPKLVDFGIGVLTDRTLLEKHQITETGFTESVLLGNQSSRTGTRMYQPPEAQLNRPADTAGDIYALGVMLYQFIVGNLSQPLGVGWEEDVDDKLLREDIRACTLRDSRSRLGSAADLAERLLTLPKRQMAYEAQQRAAHQARRLRRLRMSMAIGAFGLVVLGGLTTFSVIQWQKAKESAALAIAAATREQEEANRARRAEQDIRVVSEAEHLARVNAEKNLDRAELLLYSKQISAAQEALLGGNNDRALTQLNSCRWDLRHWEHAHLFSASHGISVQTEVAAHQNEEIADLDCTLDSNTFVSVGHDGQARIWNSQSGKVKKVFKAVPENVSQEFNDLFGVAIHPSGNFIATCGSDRFVRIWNTSTGSLEKSLSIKSFEWIDDVSFSADGEMLAAASDAEMKVWRLPMFEEFLSTDGEFSAIGFSRDGTEIVVVRDPYLQQPAPEIEVWELSSGTKRMVLDQHLLGARCFAFSHQHDLVATGGRSGEIRIWQLSTGKVVRSIQVNGTVSSIDFSRDDRRIACGNWDGMNVHLFDVKTGVEVATFAEPQMGRVTDVLFMDDDSKLVAARSDGTIQMRARAEAQPLQFRSHLGHPKGVWHISKHPKKPLVATVGHDRTVRVWSLTTGMEVFRIAYPNLRGALIGADGNLYVSAATVEVFDLDSKTRIRTLSEEPFQLSSGGDSQNWMLCGWNGPDMAKNILRIWRPATTDKYVDMELNVETIRAIAISPMDDRFVICDDKGALHISRHGTTQDWHVIPSSDTKNGLGNSLAFSPDGEKFAVVRGDGEVSIYRHSDGALLRTWVGHEMDDIEWSSISNVCFGSNADVLATVGLDGNAYVWDLSTGIPQCVRTFSFNSSALAVKVILPNQIIVAEEDGVLVSPLSDD